MKKLLLLIIIITSSCGIVSNTLSINKYKDDKKEGLWKYYHDNGQLKREGNYKDGKEDGLWKYYLFNNGHLTSEGYYKDGYENGVWKKYSLNGEIQWERTYKKGEVIYDYEDGPWENFGKVIVSFEFDGIHFHLTDTVNLSSSAASDLLRTNSVFTIYWGS